MSPPIVRNGHMQPSADKLELNGTQLATLLVFDSLTVAIQTGMNQLGGFLGLQREATMLVDAANAIQKAKESLIAEWKRKVVLAQPAALSVLGQQK